MSTCGQALYRADDPEQRRAGLEYAAPITIAENVWIGGGAILGPAVTIGENAVIGASSVVIRDVLANVVAIGNPRRVIRELDQPARRASRSSVR